MAHGIVLDIMSFCVELNANNEVTTTKNAIFINYISEFQLCLSTQAICFLKHGFQEMKPVFSNFIKQNLKPMPTGYFKMGFVSYCIVFNINLLLSQYCHLHGMSHCPTYLCCIWEAYPGTIKWVETVSHLQTKCQSVMMPFSLKKIISLHGY